MNWFSLLSAQEKKMEEYKQKNVKDFPWEFVYPPFRAPFPFSVRASRLAFAGRRRDVRGLRVRREVG
jgi:hypothetical protein